MMVDAGIVLSLHAEYEPRMSPGGKHDRAPGVRGQHGGGRYPSILPLLCISADSFFTYYGAVSVLLVRVVALIFSGFLITLIPMLSTLTGGDRARRLLSFKRMHLLEKAAFAASDRAMDVITLFFNRVIRYAMLHHRKVLGTGAALCAIGGILFLPLPTELMPAIDPGEFTLEIAAPGGTPLAETCALSARVEKLLLDKPYTRFVYAQIGRTRGHHHRQEYPAAVPPRYGWSSTRRDARRARIIASLKKE